MLKHRSTFPTVLALIALVGITTVPMTGCEDLPGSRTEQTTVIGGATGAVLGAVIAKENRLIGALIGGLLGAGGGYLIGAKTDWFENDDDDVKDEARDAVNKAQTDPATVEEAKEARTADINEDGFVTLDEVIALERADFTDNQIITRLERTNQVFDLNDDQRDILRDNGVSQKVIDRMLEINRDERDRLLTNAERDNDVISEDRD
jgi:hypothetical protein